MNEWGLMSLFLCLFVCFFLCFGDTSEFVFLANGGRNGEWMRTLMSDSDGAMTGSADSVMSGIQCRCYIVTALCVEYNVASTQFS